MKKFSIIIPIFNSDIILDTLQSFAQVEYPRDMFELILIDDGSHVKNKIKAQYGVQKYKHQFHIEYIYLGDKQGRMRVNTARNIGINVARFHDIIFIDGDSLVPHYYLQNYSNFLEHIGSNEILVGESIGYNYEDIPSIETKKILKKDYIYYLHLPKYSDFRRKGHYLEFWHVFLGGNFHITKKQIDQIGLWDEDITSWGEDDIDFAFRAVQENFSFVLKKRIEVYNIADSERITSEKFHSTMQNQCYLYKKYDYDKQYLKYVRQRFINTPYEYKRDNISSEFVTLFFKNKFFHNVAGRNDLLIIIRIDDPTTTGWKNIKQILELGLNVNIITPNQQACFDKVALLKQQYFFRISLCSPEYFSRLDFTYMYKTATNTSEVKYIKKTSNCGLTLMEFNDFDEIDTSWWEQLSGMNYQYISLDEVQTYI